MSQNIKLRRSSVPGRIPTIDQLQLGEIALNTYDGRLFLKQDINGTETIIAVGESSSLAVSASYAVTASYANTSTSASYSLTASYAINAISASYAITASYILNAISSSYAATASSADDFTVRGTLTAQRIVVQTITSSTEYVTGSTIFGSLPSNTHQFTGSVSITGSLGINGVDYTSTSGSVSTRLTSLEAFSSSLDDTFVTEAELNAATSSLSSSISLLSGSFLSFSGSYRTGSFTGSFKGDGSGILNVISSSYSLSSSYALTSSYASNVDVIISGTLDGNINDIPVFVGRTLLSGSIMRSSGSNSGSTTIVVSGSFKTDSNSTFGSFPYHTHQFTGSVLVTGSAQFTGSVLITGSAIISGSIQSNAFFGDGSYLANVGYTEKLFYVSEDGSDTNDGKTQNYPFRTIKAAVQAASASIASQTSSLSNPYRVSIQVAPGYYTEQAPIVMPKYTSIIGNDLRTTIVRPTTATSGSNLFLVDNADYFYGLRLEGCSVDDLENPRHGFFFAFAPGASISTSPYIQNCSSINTPFDKFYVPLDSGSNPPNPLVGNGPGGMIVDDSVLSGYSPLKSMIVDAYTQVAFNGIGICVRGRGYAQLVSFFTNFSRVGVYCMDGGHASLLNSNTTFGDFGLRASGSRILVVPDIAPISSSIDISGSLLLTANKSFIQNYMIGKLIVSGGFSGSYISGSGQFYSSTITDSGLLIDALSSDLLVPKAGRTSQFIQGFYAGPNFSTQSDYQTPIPSGSTLSKSPTLTYPNLPLYGSYLTGDFIKSWGYIKEYIVDDPDNRFTTMTSQGKGKITQMINTIISTVDSIQSGSVESLNYTQEFGSLITSTSHDFSYAGSGVNFLALPANQGGVGEPNVDIRIFEEAGGRVYHTSGDETGDFYAGNDFIIRQATGTIEGRTFTKAITAQITPINLALETYS
jgi:hypothetical protein